MKIGWQTGAACWIRGARAFRHINEGAGKKTKRDSSLRATPFGMTTSFKGGVDCSDQKPFATAQDKVQLDQARDGLKYAVFHFSLKFVLIWS